MGPQESYRDKHQGAYHALFRTKINDLHEDYIRPQENESHFDCDYVVFSSIPVWYCCKPARKAILLQCILLHTGEVGGHCA